MENFENIDIKKILEITFSKKILIIISLILIISMLLGYTYTYNYKIPEYKSSVTVLLVADESKEAQELTQTDLNLNSGLISTYSSIVKSNNIISKVIKNLNLNYSVKDLQNSIQAIQVNKTQFLEISVKNPNPVLAKDIANELAEVFTAEIKEIYNLQNINIVDYAEIPSGPCNINHAKDMIIFLAGGLGISVILIMSIYFIDDTIKNEQDIEVNVKLKNIGTLPIDKNNEALIIESNPKSHIVESIKTLRTNILYTTNRKTILITSCRQNEGKSWVARNLAVALAQANKTVLLVDTDFRKGSNINEIFNIQMQEGLSDLITEIVDDKFENLEKTRKYINQTQIPNLHILQNGTIPPNPSELLSSKNMEKLLKVLKNMYDIVLLDSAQCLIFADSIALSSMVDNTILVAESKKTKINDLKKAKKSIIDVSGKISGVILNKADLQKGKYYGQKYGYYYGKEDDEIGRIEEKRVEVTLDEIIEYAKINLQNEIEDNIEIIEEIDNSENNIQISNEIKNVKSQLLSEIKNLKEHIFRFRKNDKYGERFDNIVEEINNLKEIQNINNNKILEQINNKNYNEQFNQISDQINNKNYNEQFDKISEQINNKNYNEQFAQISEQINNKNYNEQFAQISDQINNKNYNEQFDKILDQINNKNYNEQFAQISEQINNKNYNEQFNQIVEQINNKNYNEEFAQISEQINNKNYNEQFNQISDQINNKNYNEQFDKISEQINNKNYNEQFAQISDQINNKNYNEQFAQISDQINNKNYNEQFDKILDQINNKNYNEQFAQISEQINNKNYNEEFAQISEQINNKNYNEQFAQISDQINNKNYNEQFAQISDQINNKNYNEQFAQISEQINNKNYNEEFEQLTDRIMNKNYNKEFAEIKDQINNKNYNEQFAQISEQINNKNYNEQFDKIEEQITNKNYEKEIELLKMQNNENMEILIETFMIQIEKMNEEIKNLRDMQINSNSELLDKVKNIDYKQDLDKINEKIDNMRYEEKLTEINQKNEENKQKIKEKANNKESNNIISFETLKQKRRQSKRVFTLEEGLSYEDLERLSPQVIDLNDEAGFETVISK